MTRKHFEDLADALRETDASPATVKAIAEVCKANNPRFDAAKFTARATA